jgi:predicted helicase
VDLHGNRKNRERAPQGVGDENVFGIDQGVAIGLFRRPASDLSTLVTYADLWGSRDQKISRLLSREARGDGQPLSPQSPDYLFVPSRRNRATTVEYSRGFPLDEIMPVHSTAAVTARDSFAVAFTSEELQERMRLFRDDSVTDDELRRRCFQHTRSRRYPPGDTRGWKLPEARKHARRAGDPDSFLRRCLYRPFDWRWVLWADWMIDWPRPEVMRHMLSGDNVALVTRRQMIPGQPANYFFVSDSIVIDGLIRSDNRGSESFFPLYLINSTGEGPAKSHNFTTEFWQACAEQWPADRTLTPEDLLYLIYAQFHSTSYRERYQSELCVDFPRVFVPNDPALLGRLVECGCELVRAHRLQQGADRTGEAPRASFQGGASRDRVVPARGFPRYENGILRITDSLRLEDVAAEAWEFHIGGHQICRKWIRDRAGRELTAAELSTYLSILAAVTDTGRIVAEIEDAIGNAGGWPSAFRSA